jgi:hypothetical protein
MNTTEQVDIQVLTKFVQRKDRITYLKRTTLLLLFFAGFSGSAIYGQNTHYRFQLQDVNDLASAKMVTDVLRPVFNTQESPFEVFPAFNDASNHFDFYASLTVTQEQLEAVLNANGIALLFFSTEDKVEPETEER